jgi:hypothetical protein
METSTAQAVYKLAIAGEQAGFSLEQMIQILDAGVSVETLLHLIELRLREGDPGPARSSRWIMYPRSIREQTD